jgi:hypothetical protein
LLISANWAASASFLTAGAFFVEGVFLGAVFLGAGFFLTGFALAIIASPFS